MDTQNQTQIQQRLSQQGPKSIEEAFEKPQFNEIELDESELEEAMRLARQEKFFRIKREEYAARISEQVVYPSHTAEQLFEEFGKIFKFTDDKHKHKIQNLCCYFAKDSRGAFDMNKGLCLLGEIGNGKTTIMKMFAVNQNHSFRVVSMLDVSFDYKTHGEPGVRGYGSNFKTAPNVYGLTEYGYCFDDVGTEEIPARHFAESKNIFSELLQVRYQSSHLIPFNSTHVTTNKNEEDLEKLYGSRCYDRMKEMFNLVIFENPSFR